MGVFVNETLANRMIDVSNESLDDRFVEIYDKKFPRKLSRRRACIAFKEVMKESFGDRYISCEDKDKRYQYHIFLDGHGDWYSISVLLFDKKKVGVSDKSMDYNYPVSINRHLIARLTQYQKDKVAYKRVGDVVSTVCNEWEKIVEVTEGSCLIWTSDGVFSATILDGEHINLYTFIPSEKLDTWKLNYFNKLDFSENKVHVTTKKDKL